MANFCSGVKVRLFGGAAGSMSSSVTSSFWARSIKGVELVKVMVSVLPVSPWREERLRQVSHVSLTDRGPRQLRGASTLASDVRPTPTDRGREGQTRSSRRWWNGRSTSSDVSRSYWRVARHWPHGSEHAHQTGSPRGPKGRVIRRQCCGPSSRLTPPQQGRFDIWATRSGRVIHGFKVVGVISGVERLIQ